MNELDLSYAAGLFDGEGCIMISRSRARGNDSTKYMLYVTVANTDVEIMSWMFQMFGGALKAARIVDGQRFGRKPCYHWRLASSKAERFLLTLTPFLRIKRKQAELALEFRRSLCVRKNGPHGQMVDDEIYRRRGFWARMKALNGKAV